MIFNSHISCCILLTVLCCGCAGKALMERVKDVPSPDAKHIATSFRMNFGATVAYCPEVFLSRTGKPLGKRGNIFRGYKDDRIRLEWKTPTHLRIYCTPDCRIDLIKEHHDGVTIELIQNWKWLDQVKNK